MSDEPEPNYRSRLLAAAQDYAYKCRLAAATAHAAKEAEVAVEVADVEVIVAINVEWAANLEDGACQQECGFHTPVADPASEAFDVADKSRSTELAKLNHSRKRVDMLNATQAATNASEEMQAAWKRLVDIAANWPDD